jgi:RimJ/RimL family protein N-acetyltransferase
LLRTERLLLRPVCDYDVDAFVEMAGDPQVMRWVGEAPGGRELAAELVERWRRRWDANGIGPFAVLVDGVVVGRAGLLVWDRRTWETTTYAAAGEHAVEELGWALSSRYWGNGYATEAARAVRDWAYRERGIGRLISLIDPKNVRSVRVAVKLGCEPEELVRLWEGTPAIVWAHPQ